MTVQPNAELLGLYDETFLSHRAADIERFIAWRDARGDRPMPTAIEIGCNRGRFLAGVARTHSPDPVLGIEWRAKFARWAVEWMGKRGHDNAEVLHGDAKLILPTIIPVRSLDAVYVTFPDPWWKQRHASRRLLEPLFMRVIARRLKPGGRLYLKSDVFDYLYRVRAFAEVSGALRPLPSDLWPDESTWALTTRERKCRQAAVPFGRGYYQRAPDFDDTLPTEPERAEDFAIDENAPAESLIRGKPPADKASKGRRRG